MPVLPLEPFVHPEHLLSGGGLESIQPGNWWVLHTRPRAEKSLARRLLRQDAQFFLPLFPRVKCVGGRVHSTQVPLFPGYLFLRGDADVRLTALETNLVARCIPVVDEERLHASLASVYQLMLAEAPLHPENRIGPGTPVEIVDGPLTGLTGKIIRRGKSLRFVVEVELLQRGVSVEIERWMFRV
ncbi:MAG: hypothetical protein K8T89_20990, partial [Planctomycetes bacterium]|nr:hypothetical protein [Planctomycetota bacterium]